MWRRCKYKLRQARFPGGPRCRGRLRLSRRGLFRLKIKLNQNKLSFQEGPRCRGQLHLSRRGLFHLKIGFESF